MSKRGNESFLQLVFYDFNENVGNNLTGNVYEAFVCLAALPPDTYIEVLIASANNFFGYAVCERPYEKLHPNNPHKRFYTNLNYEI